MVNQKVLRAAFVASLPVLMGYVSMGIAWGVLFSQIEGTNALYAGFTSAFTISGSMQFAAIEMLKNAAAYSLAMTALLAFMINIRYSAYGLPFIELFKTYPWYQRWYLILCLTDETYALQLQCPYRGDEQRHYLLLVGALDQLYWVIGGVIGVSAGRLITFDTRGIDFSMVALFIVILVDQLREAKNRIPAVIGGGITVVVLGLFAWLLPDHADKVLLVALALIVAVLILLRRRLEVAK